MKKIALVSGVAAAVTMILQQQQREQSEEIFELHPSPNHIDFSEIERRLLGNYTGDMGFISTPRRFGDDYRLYNYKETPPKPNPKTDKRKSNRARVKMARKQHRRQMSGK